MTCPSCAIAEKDPLTGHYHGAYEGQSACQECQVRAMAHSIDHVRAQDMRKITPAYKAALQVVFGDSWEAGHMRVKKWARRIDEARAGVVT